MNWLRWYHGTVTDPKWRVVAQKSKRPVAVVVAVWAAMLETASQSEPRGSIQSFNAEDIAAALDLTVDDVETVCNAMSGKVVDNSRLIAWDRRQPKREDPTSTERVQRHRGKKRDVTQGNDRGDKKRVDKKGEEGDAAPVPALLTLGEFQRCVLTHEEYRKLEAYLGAHLQDFIRQFDSWVDEAPDAKASGVRRRDRSAYKSIRNWFDRAIKRGEIKPVNEQRKLVC